MVILKEKRDKTCFRAFDNTVDFDRSVHLRTLVDGSRGIHKSDTYTNRDRLKRYLLKKVIFNASPIPTHPSGITGAFADDTPGL